MPVLGRAPLLDCKKASIQLQARTTPISRSHKTGTNLAKTEN